MATEDTPEFRLEREGWLILMFSLMVILSIAFAIFAYRFFHARRVYVIGFFALMGALFPLFLIYIE